MQFSQTVKSTFIGDIHLNNKKDSNSCAKIRPRSSQNKKQCIFEYLFNFSSYRDNAEDMDKIAPLQ